MEITMALLTVRAAAQHLGVGYSTLKQWIYQGKVRTTQTPAAAVIVSLSGRNRLRGFVEEVRVEGLMGQIRLRIGNQTLTAIVTRDAITELKLRRGDDALAIIKSTEVMIAREA
jgi:molybdopterin-binding protein